MHGPIYKLGARITCKAVNRVLASDEAIGLKQKIMLWCHLVICVACRRFRDHLRSLRAGAVRRFSRDSELSQVELKSLEDEVLKRLNQDKPS